MSDKYNTEISNNKEEIFNENQNGTSDENVTSLTSEQNSKRAMFFQRFHNKKENKKPTNAVSLASLFRYATMIDIIYMLIGTLGGLANGVLLPLRVLIVGNLISSFVERSTDLCGRNFTALSIDYCPPGYQLTASNYFSSIAICHLNETTFDFQGEIKKQIVYAVANACASIVLSYTQIVFWCMAAERQAKAIRKELFQSILRKEIVYFDLHKTGELNTKLTDDVDKIHYGIGDKLAFVKGWKLTLIALSTAPLLFVSGIFFFKLASDLTATELKAYSKAGAIAEEVFWSIIIGVFSFGQASPHFQALAQAQAAAYIVWEVIDGLSKINSDSETGLKKDNLIGDINFSNVHFSYPSRPGIKVLNGISFDAKHGQTIALVGSSGSGKSTCVQLLQRFYDSDLGSISIDGHQVTEYNLKWLRQHIGVVSQEPILFQATIRENILFGRDTATDKEVYEAAKMANAHDFIMTFPDKYETRIGERGATLSGGQKQRIGKHIIRICMRMLIIFSFMKFFVAIARALIRDPKILLLDEATSALDNENEKIVQEALDRAAEGRTTLVIAHRLSTIRNANKIIVMYKGNVVEEGDHESLMHARGTYFALVEQQNLHKTEREEQLALERQECSGSNVPNQTEEIQLGFRRKCASIVNSVASSAMNELNGKKTNLLTDEEEVEEEDAEIKQKKEKKPNTALQVLIMNKPEWILIIFGCVACLCNGGVEPAFSIILSKLVVVFQECDKEVQKQRILVRVLLFIGLGVLIFITMFIQSFLFACSGEALTKRLRSKSFHAILRQEIAYFDNPDNNTGALCTRLATEASAVQGASGIHIGIMLQNIVSLGTCIIMSFVFSWQLTLLVLAFIPFVVAGGFLQNHLMTGFASKDKRLMEKAGKVTVESIQNIRTVVQLTKEDYFYEQYCSLLEIPYQSSIKRANLVGLFFSLTNSIMYFSVVALFSLGAHLIQEDKITFDSLLLCFNCIIFGAQNVGQTASIMAVQAAENILELLNRKPSIDNDSSDGDEIPNFNGDLEFVNFHFIYPNRPESVILKDFTLKIRSGRSSFYSFVHMNFSFLSLLSINSLIYVGASGCGKSTTIQLIERFYDANGGQLLVDSKDIRSLNLQWYRSQIGVVSQEPVLFDMSIKENIAYGDNSRSDIPMEEIIEAAKNANIHNFIQKLPNGYDTNCGAKGTQLSGGEKQRIAIARALIRNPKILLFDEDHLATSALDSENEKIVQEALDQAQKNRTSITIAHRLSTIQNADMICVLHNGVVVESGTHQELFALRGHYYYLAIGKLK
ncbi:unnamed protein product [Rotaria sp. Silwood2]|nr:unnamed protein product [Rotaria sp. Silwood2]